MTLRPLRSARPSPRAQSIQETTPGEGVTLRRASTPKPWERPEQGCSGL